MKVWLAVAAVLAPDAARAAEPLPPLGKWTVGYEDTLCTLSRTFGSATAPTTLIVSPHLSGDEEQIALLTSAGSDAATRRGKGRIVLQPSDEGFAVEFASGTISGGQRGTRIDVKELGIRPRLEEATGMIFETNGVALPALALGNTAGALRALKACQDDLLRRWGADPAAMATPVTPYTAASWFSRDTYPPDALAARAQGRVIVVASVDRAGRTTACRVAFSGGHPGLDRGTCDVVRGRGRFLPAGLEAPETRYAVVAVTWRLQV